MTPPPELPQTRLSISSNAATLQLLAVQLIPIDENNPAQVVILADPANNGYSLSVPFATFPYLRENEPVLVSITLTRVAVEPANEQRGLLTPGLIDPSGRRLS